MTSCALLLLLPALSSSSASASASSSSVDAPRFLMSSFSPPPSRPSQQMRFHLRPLARCSGKLRTAVAPHGDLVVSATKPTLEKPVIVIDNYDSFTYNLCQYLASENCPFEVYRNDELSIKELREKQPSGILISPGPGTPKDSGISLDTVIELGADVPIFGVCMGLQCMGEAFGGKIIRSPFGVVHGKKSLVYYDEHGEDGLLAGLPNPFIAGRYHSLVIDRDTFPSDKLEITAWTDDGLIMGVRHKVYRHVQGVQFHPESIITASGIEIIRNFLSIIKRKSQTITR